MSMEEIPPVVVKPAAETSGSAPVKEVAAADGATPLAPSDTTGPAASVDTSDAKAAAAPSLDSINGHATNGVVTDGIAEPAKPQPMELDATSQEVNSSTVDQSAVPANAPATTETAAAGDSAPAAPELSPVVASIPQPAASLDTAAAAAPASAEPAEESAVALNHTATVDAPLSDVRKSPSPTEKPAPEAAPSEPAPAAPQTEAAPAPVAPKEEPMPDAPSAAVEPPRANEPAFVTSTTSKHELDAGDEPTAKRARVESPGPKGGSVADAPTGPESAGRMAANRQKYCLAVLRQLKKGKDAVPFNHPVDPIKLNIPQYPTIITNPMDLGTIDKKLGKGDFATVDEFVDAVELVWTNCITFNGPDSVISQMALRLKEQFERQMRTLPEPEDKPAPTPKGKAARVGKANAAATPSGTPSAPRPRKNSSPATNGVPVIRRDSTGVDGRPKREIHAPPPKSLPYSNQPARRTKNAAQLRFCEQVIKELHKKQHESFAFPFYTPVDPVALGIPEYTKIVKQPMDLGTVQARLKAGEYESSDDFESDVRLIFRNCYKFNPAGSPVNAMGKQLEAVFNEKWAEKPVPRASAAAGAGSDEEADSDDEKNETVQMLHKQLEAMKNQIADLSQKKKGGSAKKSRKSTGFDDDHHAAGSSSKPGKHKFKIRNEPDESPMLPTFEQKTALSTKMSYMTEHQMPVVVAILKQSDPTFDPEDEEVELDVDKIHPKTIRLLWNWVMEGIEPSFMRKGARGGAAGGGAGGANAGRHGGGGGGGGGGAKAKKNRAILTENEQQRQIDQLEKQLNRIKNGGGAAASNSPAPARGGGGGGGGGNGSYDRYGGRQNESSEEEEEDDSSEDDD